MDFIHEHVKRENPSPLPSMKKGDFIAVGHKNDPPYIVARVIGRGRAVILMNGMLSDIGRELPIGNIINIGPRCEWTISLIGKGESDALSNA
jgi:hypothetical protein